MAVIYGDYGDFGRFCAAKNKPKQTQSWLAPSTAVGLKTNLKKQSQFVEIQVGLNSCMKGNYEEFCPFRRRKNKANQSQFYLAPRFSGGCNGFNGIALDCTAGLRLK